jgi:hypothetical protein
MLSGRISVERSSLLTILMYSYIISGTSDTKMQRIVKQSLRSFNVKYKKQRGQFGGGYA